tara:strand:- start:185 stop:367 length:183 start_codon:yes stop_codon:yes gene_type:complete
MGRKKKYYTKEEKKEAQRKWQSEHYDRNREEILQKARDRYRRKKLAEKRKEQRKNLYGEK